AFDPSAAHARRVGQTTKPVSNSMNLRRLICPNVDQNISYSVTLTQKRGAVWFPRQSLEVGFCDARVMSALPPRAGIGSRDCDVRFGPQADYRNGRKSWPLRNQLYTSGGQALLHLVLTVQPNTRMR